MSRLLILIALLLPIAYGLRNSVSRRVSSRSMNSITSRSITKLNLFDGLKKMVGSVDTGEQLTMENEKLIKKYMNIVNDINKLEVYTYLLTHSLIC